MKILYITTNFRSGGAATGSRNLASSLEQYDNVKVIRVDKYSPPLYKRLIFTIFRGIERTIEKFLLRKSDSHFLKLAPSTLDILYLEKLYAPDIIQLGFIAGNIINVSDLQKLRVPVVMRLSDFWPFLGPYHYPEIKFSSLNKREKLASFLLKINNKKEYFSNINLVCPSKWTKSLIESSDYYFSKVQYIPNAVKTNESVLTSYHENEFVAISKILDDPRKGVYNLIIFLSCYYKTFGKFKIHLIGNYTNKLKKSIEKLNISSCVIFHGPLNKKEIDVIVSKSAYLICPSIYDNSPNTLTESLSIGVPVIAQKDTGMDSYIYEEKNGYLFDFLDISESNIRRFSLINSSRNTFDKTKVIELTKNEFSYQVVSEKYINLYRELL